LNDSLRDRFICGLRSEQIKRKLLSTNFTFQEAVDAAIAQETAQKDVRDLGSEFSGRESVAERKQGQARQFVVTQSHFSAGSTSRQK